MADKESEIRQREAALAAAQKSVDEQIATKLAAERGSIAAAEAKKARDALSDQIAQAQQEKIATEELLKDRNAKLLAAQKAELGLPRSGSSFKTKKTSSSW